MKQKQIVSIKTQNLLYKPYTKEVVPIYHQWMLDPQILYLTASEPLTLEEELENQQSWLNDHTKHTFIIYTNYQIPIGDVNMFHHQYLEDNEAEIDVMIAEKDFRSKGYAQEAVRMMMSYGLKAFNKNTFIAKIKEDNQPSIGLFKKLGFQEIKRVKAFNEIHFSLTIDKSLIEYEYL